MQGGYEKSLFSTSIVLHRVLPTLRQSGVINTVLPDRGKLVTLIAGSSKRHSVLMAGDDDETFMTKKRQRYAEDNRTAFNWT